MNVKWIAISIIIQASILPPIYWLLSQAKLGNPQHLFFLSETFLILFVAPIIPTALILSIQKRLHNLYLNFIKSFETVLGCLIAGQLYILFFLALSFIATNIMSTKWHLTFSAILNAHLFLLVCLFTYGTIGILFAILTKELLFSIVLTYLVSAFFVSAVILATPLTYHIDNSDWIKSLVLNTNPIVAICGTIRFDIFRTQYLYEIAPIGSSVPTYPAWYAIGLWHFLSMLICLGISSLILNSVSKLPSAPNLVNS